MEDYMKKKKKVIDSITVCGLCAMLTVTAVTNSGRSEVKAEDKVLANTGLEHTGYNSYAGWQRLFLIMRRVSQQRMLLQ